MNGISIKDKLFTELAFKITLECPRNPVNFPNPDQHANNRICVKTIHFN